VHTIPCADLMAGPSQEASVSELQDLLGEDGISSCDENLELVLRKCADPHMNKLRAFCPVTCGCRDKWNSETDINDFTGWPATIFGSKSFGCPETCQAYRTALSAHMATLNSTVMTTTLGVLCSDVAANGLVNPAVDFDSLPAVDDAGKPIRYDVDSIYVPRWFHAYIGGLLLELSLNPRFPEYVFKQALDFESVGAIQPGQAESLFQHVVSRDILKTIVGGTWELMPGTLHPRGLEGCAYLASYELRVLLGRDLCEPDNVRSIRHICPVTCGCGSMTECPVACWTSG